MTRVTQAVASNCSEAAREAFRENEHERAASLLKMTLWLRPEPTRACLDLARARALLGNKKATLAPLERAAAAGFKDAPAVEWESSATTPRCPSAPNHFPRPLSQRTDGILVMRVLGQDRGPGI